MQFESQSAVTVDTIPGSHQPRPQGLLLVQNGGRKKPLTEAAKMAPKIR